MEKKFNRTLVTSALPYANGGVHIGHLAGVYVPADIYVRYLRLKKQEVLFIGGSDEHGVPVTIRARKEGITTQEVVDRYHNLIKNRLRNSAYHSTSTAERPRRSTTSLPLISSARFTTTTSSWRKPRSNSAMK